MQKVTETLKHAGTRLKTADETWCIFRDTVLDAFKNICGTKRLRSGERKSTKWWKDKVKEAVKKKEETLHIMGKITDT